MLSGLNEFREADELTLAKIHALRSFGLADNQEPRHALKPSVGVPNAEKTSGPVRAEAQISFANEPGSIRRSVRNLVQAAASALIIFFK